VGYDIVVGGGSVTCVVHVRDRAVVVQKDKKDMQDMQDMVSELSKLYYY
jgi:hypothetical protein